MNTLKVTRFGNFGIQKWSTFRNFKELMKIVDIKIKKYEMPSITMIYMLFVVTNYNSVLQFYKKVRLFGFKSTIGRTS
jgi:hypothetical protein